LERVRGVARNGGAGTVDRAAHYAPVTNFRRPVMRSALLWFIGVPIPIILLLAFCTHHL
jgi:hypothetical protein